MRPLFGAQAAFQFLFSLLQYNDGGENMNLEQSHESRPTNVWEMERFPDRCLAVPLFEHSLYARKYHAKNKCASGECFGYRFS